MMAPLCLQAADHHQSPRLLPGQSHLTWLQSATPTGYWMTSHHGGQLVDEKQCEETPRQMQYLDQLLNEHASQEEECCPVDIAGQCDKHL